MRGKTVKPQARYMQDSMKNAAQGMLPPLSATQTQARSPGESGKRAFLLCICR